ncbi:MAG: diguanylate cyclase [Thermodesulfobacteriota bacterium]
MTISIRTKIIISCSLIFVMLTFLGGITYYNRNILFRGILGLENEVNTQRNFSELQLSMDRVVMPPNDYLITGDPAERQRFDELVAEVERGFDALGEDNGKHIKAVKGLFEELKGKAAEIFAIRKPVGNARGVALMREMDQMSHRIIAGHIEKYAIENREKIAREIASVDAVRKRVNTLILVGGTASVVIMLLVVRYLAGSILRPIFIFREGAHIIGGGNLDYRIDLKDGLEMNMLADEFNRMAARLRESYRGLEVKVEERTQELNELNVKLKELAITDGLTDVYNHRHFFELLDAEIKRAARYNHPFSLVMADIDHFKAYNDHNGHPEGDKVLKGVAACFTDGVREQDIVARYGGEEFTLILPETGKSEAIVVAERIRKLVQDAPFPNRESQPGGRLTASFGVAAYPVDAVDARGLMEAADNALYEAKRAGRNRVEAFTFRKGLACGQAPGAKQGV